MKELAETSELLAFATTVDSKSLARAAAELGVPRATISRRLARLEERLGVRLLRRTTRRLVLTDAGDAFYRHARIAIDAVANAEQSVRRGDDGVRGTLRVSMPPLVQTKEFNVIVCDFCERYPDVRLEIHASTGYVDLLSGGFDVAIPGGVKFEAGVVARTLLRTPIVAEAAPSYLDRAPPLKSARDLRKHKCLVGFASGDVARVQWPQAGGGEIHVEAAFVASDVFMIRDATLRGLGVALMPLTLVAPHIASGQLVRVLEGVVEAEARLAVVFAEREFVPAKVRAFVDAISQWVPAGFDEESVRRHRALAPVLPPTALLGAVPKVPPSKRQGPASRRSADAKKATK